MAVSYTHLAALFKTPSITDIELIGQNGYTKYQNGETIKVGGNIDVYKRQRSKSLRRLSFPRYTMLVICFTVFPVTYAACA